MARSGEAPEYVVQIAYGGEFFANVDGTRLLKEGHFLFALFPEGSVRLFECKCEKCATAPGHDLDLVPPEQLFGWIMENIKPKRVRLVVRPDMALPLADGTKSSALAFAEAMAQAFASDGVAAIVTDTAIDNPSQLGQWVRFVKDDIVSPSNVVVAGMVGRVVADPYTICTPGVSVMVEPVGLKLQYGYWCTLVESMEPPTDDDVEKAKQLAARAAEIYQEKNGWRGLAMVGLPQDRALRELQQLTGRVGDLDAKAARGSMKRIAQILDGFKPSPWGEQAVALAGQCRANPSDKAAVQRLVQDVKAWMKAVERDGN